MKYVQFSKRMVLLVVSAVTCLTGAAMILCYLSAHFPEIVKLVDAYIGFATICFAAYSGNSAVEKYLVRRYHEGTQRHESDEGEHDRDAWEDHAMG